MIARMHSAAVVRDGVEQAARRWPRKLPIAVMSAITLVVVLVTVPGNIGHVFGNPKTPPVAAGAPLSSAPARSSPAAPSQMPAAQKVAPPLPRHIDNRGFIDSPARCDDTQTLAAIGRTDQSQVVICKTADAAYEYRGVRTRIGTSITLGGAVITPTGFEVRNEGVTYAVSSTELLIMSDYRVLSQERMVEYQDARSVTSAARPAQNPPPAPVARPAVPPPPAHPLLPVSAQGNGNGEVKFTATAPWTFHYVVRCPADTAVQGFIDARLPNGAIVSSDLRGDSSSVREGTSRQNRAKGQIALAVQPFDVRCTWQVAVYP